MTNTRNSGSEEPPEPAATAAAGSGVGLQRSTPITSSFKAINHGYRWKNILKPGDKFMQTVKLEGAYEDHNRYLCIVSHSRQIVCHNNNADEYCLLGIDEEVKTDGDETGGIVNATIGLVCKTVHGVSVNLDGDGGFTYHHIDNKQYIFKPVSVQALWTVIQTLMNLIAERLKPTTIAEDDWIHQYEKRINSPQSWINEWHTMADVLVRRPPSPHRTPKSGHGGNSILNQSPDDFEITLKSGLRQIMKGSNLDTITSKKIRIQLEADLKQSLEDYKSFIDKEILVILGQMDPASKILDYLYLGSEWNASNLEELRANGITRILNVTREIDNFFPADFQYKNIRVYDEEATDLLRFFEETYKFIKEAKETDGKTLVHCKMGISRSATCTIAFIMKEYGKDMVSALLHAKERRSIVNPNKSFIKQLEVYEGILEAGRHRQGFSRLFRSKSTSAISIQDEVDPARNNNRKSSPAAAMLTLPIEKGQSDHLDVMSQSMRPKSWSPNEKIAHFLMDQADRLSKSATTASGGAEQGDPDSHQVIDPDCGCFDQLSMQISSELVPSSPVNSVCNVIDPHCECNVELELSVPTEPVCVSGHPDDLQTDVIVQSLAQLPIQMRTSNSLLEDLRTSGTGGSVSSSVSSTTSVPTTPIFSLKRRSSVDASFLNPHPPPAPPPPSIPLSSVGLKRADEVLSVKTLANMYDFKVVNSIPFRPCCARLEDNHIFQRMAKQLDDDNETDC